MAATIETLIGGVEVSVSTRDGFGVRSSFRISVEDDGLIALLGGRVRDEADKRRFEEQKDFLLDSGLAQWRATGPEDEELHATEALLANVGASLMGALREARKNGWTEVPEVEDA